MSVSLPDQCDISKYYIDEDSNQIDLKQRNFRINRFSEKELKCHRILCEYSSFATASATSEFHKTDLADHPSGLGENW